MSTRTRGRKRAEPAKLRITVEVHPDAIELIERICARVDKDGRAKHGAEWGSSVSVAELLSDAASDGLAQLERLYFGSHEWCPNLSPFCEVEEESIATVLPLMLRGGP